MTSLIKILPDHLVNKIAAGEVVERPAAVVKELVENSLDAGATEIFIDIEQAGRKRIRVADNGSGMSKKDAQTAFLRHATSKIQSEEDLDAVRTMGFRGEALSSIASVSQVMLLTAERGAASGVLVEVEAGAFKSVADAAAPEGTSVDVAHLFYNTPARLKFLKSPGTEFSHIVTAVSRLAMAHPSIRFRLTHNRKKVLDLPASTNIRDRTFQIYGSELAENVMTFSGGRDGVHIHGLIGRPTYSRGDRTHQDFFVNRRAVKNTSISHALYDAYSGMLMRDRHPVGFIFLEIDPALVDVNVHPAKAEVRFRNQSQIHDLVRDVVREGLRLRGMPAAAAAPAPVSGEERVREAVAEYTRAQEGRGVPERKPLVLFGRRRSDVTGSEAWAEADAAPRRESAEGVPKQYAFVPEHDLVPIAQIHDSFIVAQSREGMAIIDQHAAHERVLFEKLQDQFGGGMMPLQNLLVPVQVELGPAQGALLSEHLVELHSLGFIVEEFGSGTFVIKAVPSLVVGADYRQLLLDILDEVNAYDRSGKMEKLRDEILSIMACHPAIKTHRQLDLREMEALLRGIFACRMPYTCPHGRPTIIRFSLDEIKKMFKRM